ncbi:MAG: hypothetical protein GOVbin4162_97 [Prokaryotic dsDNA virus sp.]|nr:MAG: hypothetical protein GOVbin4162_97 [Prokaryotic dsDNA virus sp.]|tara:strand:+ start:124 stop:504 length:381 start_codon:yes stop_codon:yes gene_type:complete
MNEKLQEALNQFLTKIIEGLGKAGDMAVEQIPDVVQQAMTWFMLESLLLSLLSLPFFIVGGVILRKCWKKGGWHEEYCSDDMLGANLASAVAIGLGLTIVITNIEWLQILVAPKWFIVSEMSKLVL